MAARVRNYRFRLFGTLAVAALSLLGLAVPLSPTKAQCLGVDLGLVCAGLGTPSAFSHPYYYGYPYVAYPAFITLTPLPALPLRTIAATGIFPAGLAMPGPWGLRDQSFRSAPKQALGKSDADRVDGQQSGDFR
jgi:hypothetical protein